jgi:hypothetical protein
METFLMHGAVFEVAFIYGVENISNTWHKKQQENFQN